MQVVKKDLYCTENPPKLSEAFQYNSSFICFFTWSNKDKKTRSQKITYLAKNLT